jgi:hypothetical protein
MGKHRITLGRRGAAALVAAGALVIGGATASMIGTGNADVLDALTAGTTTTTVLPDLAPFKADDNRGAGKAEVSDEYGAPTGGGKAALRLSTPTGDDKVNYYAAGDDAGTPLAEWVPTAAYSAYQGAADNPIQFPSLQLVVDYNGADAGGFATLTYEPVYNPGDSTTPDEWHRYQAGAGNWCSTKVIPGVIDANQTFCSNGGAKPLTDYTASTGIVVNAVYINQGSGNPGLESAVDLITTPSTTYDFELTKPVIVPPITDPPTTEPTTPTHPGNPGGHGGGHWGGDGQPGHGNGSHDGGWGDDQGNGQDDGHCGCG